MGDEADRQIEDAQDSEWIIGLCPICGRLLDGPCECDFKKLINFKYLGGKLK